MAKSKESLITEIDNNIKTNGNAEITGAVLNSVLKSMVGNVVGGFFSFPKDASLSLSDVGKVVMNDGSGTAKVYQLSPPQVEQLGRWVVVLEELEELSNDSMISIDSNSYNTNFNRATWRNGNLPTTALEELELIKDYIDANSNLSFLTVSIVGDDLVIVENTYTATEVNLRNFSNEGSFIDILSRPALPAAPTAFPLGKLVGIEGDLALISAGQVETYPLEGSLTIDNSLYNNNTDIDLVDVGDLVSSLGSHIIVPTDNGKVKAFDVNDLNMDSAFLASLRHHFIGIAITSTTNTVTVMNMNSLSFVLNLVLKIATKSSINK